MNCETGEQFWIMYSPWLCGILCKKYFRVEVPTIYENFTGLVHISFSFPGESYPSPLLGESIPAVDILICEEYIVTTSDQ